MSRVSSLQRWGTRLLAPIAACLIACVWGVASAQAASPVPCSSTVSLVRVPAKVTVVAGARQITGPTATAGLRLGARARITVRGSERLDLSIAGNRYVLAAGRFTLGCARVLVGSATREEPENDLSVRVLAGQAQVRAGSLHPEASALLTPQLVAEADVAGTELGVHAIRGASTAHTENAPITVAAMTDQGLRITAQPSYTAIMDGRGLRLNVWPFSLSADQRPSTAADRLTPYWADGSTCAVGCSSGAAGWPLKPFHRPHALQAGYTDFRPSGFHVGIDIEATNNEPVYSIRSGFVGAIRYSTTSDVNVDVGGFDYWHIKPTVRVGQWVTAYKTVIGTVLWGQGHIDVSEGPPGTYLNPLRPGGGLLPYSDTIAPVIGTPHLYAGGRATVGVFDPQSVVEKNTYLTPVITPAAVAWRLSSATGRPVTGLEWALRGSHWLPPAEVDLVYAPGAYAPGWNCYAFYRLCKPNFDYWLAGGLTEALPLDGLAAGRYRLTVYAWNYAGVSSARDVWITLPLHGLGPAPTGSPLYANCPAAGACSDRWIPG